MRKLRARCHQRSLRGEAKSILEEAAVPKLEDAKELIEKIRAQFSGKTFSDSTTLIRRDRQR